MLKGGYALRGLTFEYQGIARQELEAARSVGRTASLAEHRFVRLPDLKEAGDMVGTAFRGLPPTYIPMRNSIFYSFAASYAEENRAGLIVGGHNRDDSKTFRDVSPEFFKSLEHAFQSGSRVLGKRKVRIVRPLERLTKIAVVKNAVSLGVPFELTWSCHRDGDRHCWECSGCQARRAAFIGAGAPDPLYP